MEEFDFCPATDKDYFDAFDIMPSDEDQFEDLRAVFEFARMHGITPLELRQSVLHEKGNKVHFIHPAALADMMQIEHFLSNALLGQGAVIEGQQCAPLTHNPVVNVTSLSSIVFEGATLLGLKQCITRLRGISVSALINHGFILELEIEGE